MSEVTIGDLVAEMEAVGIQLWEDAGQIRFRAPKGTMTDERRALLRRRKADVVRYLAEGMDPEAVVRDVESLHAPFPLTDVQSAYLLGRDPAFDYGGVGCQVYLEAALGDLDPIRLDDAWRHLIDRHPMLRATVDPAGAQRILERVPAYSIEVVDVRDGPAGDATAAVEAVRRQMCDRSYEPDQWPLFDVRLTRLPDESRLHISFDLLVADFMSIQLLLDELHQLYFEPAAPLPPIDVTYRDYVLAERQLTERRRYQRARQYWWDRIDSLPLAPQLPVLDHPETRGAGRFQRWQTRLGPTQWANLRASSGEAGISPSGAVLTVYAEIIGRWTRQDFTLDITLLNRLPLHPHAERLVGDFTTVDLLAIEQNPSASFGERARQVQGQLWADMDHIGCSGVEVLRELGRRRGRAAALMPIVYTSAIALNEEGRQPRFWRDAQLVYGLTQTPQVWIDCQVMAIGGELVVNWDVREGVFPPGLIDDMFVAFEQQLQRVAADPDAWKRPLDIPLPLEQAARRTAANDSADPALPAHTLLHEAVVDQCQRDPGRVALVSPSETLSFGDVLARSAAVSKALAERSLTPGELVAIALPKSPTQLCAVLGVLRQGGAYLPIDSGQPAARRDQMLTDAGVRLVLTDSTAPDDLPPGIEAIATDTITPTDEIPGPSSAAANDLAYVIYTSGSTGRPKGVQISHCSALNTIEDINQRFAVTSSDRILGLANLGFDLSVYDLFGPLAAGGAVVLPDPDGRNDPSHWADLIERHRVTMWNSVPAQMQMLADFLETDPGIDVSSLRLALLSGDWIPVNLPGRVRRRVPDIELVSLGGATEAAIWSIFYPIGEVPDGWRSIPYGRPLANQTFHVLDRWGRDCPDGAVGELYIGGVGVAAGYLGDPEKTAERFVTHPQTGVRLYRTGDLGRYLPDGNIEFLGREDAQVKIRGHRIELAEVEAAIGSDPRLAAVAVAVDGDSPFDRRLVAVVEPGRRAATPGEDAPLRVLEVASEAGEAVMAGVDRDRYVDYIRRLDEIALLAMVDAFRSRGLFATPSSRHSVDEVLEQMRVAPRHRRVVRRWLRALDAEGYLKADHDTYWGARSVDAASVAAAWQEVDAMLAEVDPEAGAVHDYFKASTRRLPEQLQGATAEAVQLLFPEGSVERSVSLYNVTRFNRWANQVLAATARQIASEKTASGRLRVLEVGAGVGGTSKDVIAALDGYDVEYVFTDLSRFFLNQAEKAFGDYPWIRYATLDINADFRQQGFSSNSFDVVVLGDVLHATRHVGRSLVALRQLLAPGGWLLFAEMTRDHYQIMTSMELLLVDESTEGDFEDVRRGKDRAFVEHSEWLRLLSRPGDETVYHLPADGDRLAELGLHVYATRVKTDRIAVHAHQVIEHIFERLPQAMIPSAIEIVDDLPLTANGKVDRDRLRSCIPRSRSAAAGVSDEPVDEFERRIAGLWGDVLGLPHVGRNQGFFDLGGDSLLASELTRSLIEHLPEVSGSDFNTLLRQLLEGPTVATLGARIREAP